MQAEFEATLEQVEFCGSKPSPSTAEPHPEASAVDAAPLEQFASASEPAEAILAGVTAFGIAATAAGSCEDAVKILAFHTPLSANPTSGLEELDVAASDTQTSSQEHVTAVFQRLPADDGESHGACFTREPSTHRLDDSSWRRKMEEKRLLADLHSGREFSSLPRASCKVAAGLQMPGVHPNIAAKLKVRRMMLDPAAGEVATPRLSPSDWLDASREDSKTTPVAVAQPYDPATEPLESATRSFDGSDGECKGIADHSASPTEDEDQEAMGTETAGEGDAAEENAEMPLPSADFEGEAWEDAGAGAMEPFVSPAEEEKDEEDMDGEEQDKEEEERQVDQTCMEVGPVLGDSEEELLQASDDETREALEEAEEGEEATDDEEAAAELEQARRSAAPAG